MSSRNPNEKFQAQQDFQSWFQENNINSNLGGLLYESNIHSNNTNHNHVMEMNPYNENGFMNPNSISGGDQDVSSYGSYGETSHQSMCGVDMTFQDHNDDLHSLAFGYIQN